MAAVSLLKFGIQLIAMWATPDRIAKVIAWLRQSPEGKPIQSAADAFVGISAIIAGTKNAMDPATRAKIDNALRDLQPELQEHVDQAKSLEDRLS